jgi:hypothetical protein
MNFWLGVLVGWAICTPLTILIIAFISVATSDDAWDEE